MWWHLLIFFVSLNAITIRMESTKLMLEKIWGKTDILFSQSCLWISCHQTALFFRKPKWYTWNSPIVPLLSFLILHRVQLVTLCPFRMIIYISPPVAVYYSYACVCINELCTDSKLDPCHCSPLISTKKQNETNKTPFLGKGEPEEWCEEGLQQISENYSLVWIQLRGDWCKPVYSCH